MAVQSQYPSNVILAENHGNRNTRVIEDRGYPGSFLTKFQAPAAVMQQQQAGVNQFHLFNQLAGGHPYAALDASILNAVNAAEKQIGSRKRAREGDDLRGQWQPQQQQVLVDFQNPGTVVNPGVSTGLRLAFEDDRLRSTSPVSTSGRVETVAELSHLQQERDEIEQILKIQSEQLRTFLDEKRQRHSRELLAAAEEGFSRRLREKDAEMVKVKRQNQELLERYNQLNVELQHWQAKLRNTETMVTILRSNLHQVQQQPLPLSREQSKEGCGDSEADDCASSYVDDRNDAHIRTFNENKELREQRTCRVCRSNDVSMLLLPCRHLCLCQDCEGQLVACPLCRTRKNASVQVYMS